MSGWGAGPERRTKGTVLRATDTPDTRPVQPALAALASGLLRKGHHTCFRGNWLQSSLTPEPLASALVVGTFAKSYYCTGWRGFRARLDAEQWYMSQHVASTNPSRPLPCPRDGTGQVYGTDIFQVTAVVVREFLKE